MPSPQPVYLPELGKLGEICHGTRVMVPDIEALRVPLTERTAQTQVLLVLGVRPWPFGRQQTLTFVVAELISSLIASSAIARLLLPLAAPLRLPATSAWCRRIAG